MNLFTPKQGYSAPGLSRAVSRLEKDPGMQRCCSTLLSNEIRDLLVRTMHSWVELFDESNRLKLPQFKIGLVLENNIMQFYPPYDALEKLVLSVIDIVGKTLQEVISLFLFLFLLKAPFYIHIVRVSFLF